MGVVPIPASLWLGRRLGTLAFFFNKKRRLVAYANLKAAFANEKSPAELRAVTKRVYQNLLQTFVEVLNLTKVNREYVNRYVEVVNMGRIQGAAKSGRGTILLTAHFGDWELSSLVSSVKGFPILVLAREQKMKRLNELLNRLRESNGCTVIRKGMSTKNILRALHDRHIVGILSDQDAGRDGMFVDFFGRPTSCHSGPFEIAKRTGSLILPNFIVRTKGPRHKLFLEEYIDFRASKSEDNVRENLQKFARVLESYVRRYPDQWLWMHKRWKSTPTRKILVLNDGKAGHLNQSLAVARELQKARAAQGYQISDTTIEIIDVKFKNAFLKAAMTLCASFASWRCHGCMRCMRACLEKKSYDTLMKTYAEFVISCGSGLAAVNVFMSKENNAKNIIVMKPNMLTALFKFNLAVIPKHDLPKPRKNVVQTIAAPNLIDEEGLTRAGDLLKRSVGPIGDRVVGLFIGGDNPEFSLTESIAGKVLDGLDVFCKENDAFLLVTTSRRTSKAVEGLLKKRLENNPGCKLLVIANERNLDEAVAGILALSKVAVVSEESISMVSEAISSRKVVVVFRLKKKKGRITKHERALQALEKDGYVSIAVPEALPHTLERAWKDARPVKELEDRKKIFEAVRRLI